MAGEPRSPYGGPPRCLLAAVPVHISQMAGAVSSRVQKTGSEKNSSRSKELDMREQTAVTLDVTAPTAGFFSAEGPVPW